MTPVLRRATAQDADLIHQLLQEMATAEGGQIKGSPQTITLHGFGPTPRFRVLLAEGADPLGLILFFPEYSSWRGQMGVYVQDLYLRPAARGQGLGRALLGAALRDADWNPAFVTLMVAHTNHAARAFYAALGFVQRDPADPFILAEGSLAALNAR